MVRVEIESRESVESRKKILKTESKNSKREKL